MSLYHVRAKDGHDIWIYNFKVGGTRYNRRLGKVTQAQAEAMYAEMKALVREHRGQQQVKALEQCLGLATRVDDFAAEFFVYYRSHVSPRSVERYEYAYRALKPVFGPQRLSDITPQAIEEYKRQRQAAGRGPVTINKELDFLKHLYKMAIAWGNITRSPLTHVQQLREPHRTRYLTLDEEARLLAACNPRLRAVVIAALQTGARRSELLSLTWRDLDVERRLVTIDAAQAKTKETRTLPMSELLFTTLQALPHPAEPGALVFGYRSINKSFQRAVQRAGLTNVRFHDLRHTFASRLVQRGAPLAHVKELLGHHNIRMTMRYAHLNQEHTRATIALLTDPNGTGSQQTGEPDTSLRPSKIPLADVQAILQALAQLGVVDLNEGAIEERSPA